MVNVHSETKYSIATSDFRCLECAGEVACEAFYYSAVIFGEGAFQRRNYCIDCWKRELIPKTGGKDTRSQLDAFASWRSRRPAAASERQKKIRFDPQLGLEFFLRLGEKLPETIAREAALDASSDAAPDAADSVIIQQAAPDGGASEAGGADAGEPVVEERDNREPVVREIDSSQVRAFPGAQERDQLRFFLSLLLVRKKALKFKSSIDRGGQEFLLLADRETPPRVHEVLNPGLSDDQLEGLKDRLGELLQMQI